MDPKEKYFFFRVRANKKACNLRSKGATAWVTPNPGHFFKRWACFWYA